MPAVPPLPRALAGGLLAVVLATAGLAQPVRTVACGPGGGRGPAR